MSNLRGGNVGQVTTDFIERERLLNSDDAGLVLSLKSCLAKLKD